MPKYDIKRGAAIIASVIAEGSQNVEAMGVNEVTMKFTLITPVVFQVGDWCQVYGNKYVVYRKPEYTKVNERQHEYDLYLVHEFYKLQDSLLMGIDKNAILNEKVFDLTGNLQAFADLVLLNANRNDSGWTLGTVDTTDAKTLQFDGENILASLNRIASEFETEFWIEGKTISFAKRLTNSGITLSYGENKGLISLTKGNKDANATIFTRLFVEGAERNLPSYTNYGFKRLQLPSANNGKVDNTSAIASFGVIEHYAKFDDIYPKHIGTVTSVGDEFTFYDTALPFDVNAQLLPGVTAYVAFQTGLLAGYNFDIASFDNATKKFVINENEDEKTATLPNSTLKPAVGDKYIVFDIQMPQTHIDNASNELLTKANELLAQGSDIDFNDAFTGVCDPLYFKRNSITPVLGQYARLFETNPAIDVTKRMSKISRDLQNPDKYEITFTDKIEVNTVVREYIKTIEETNVINETVERTIINRDAVRRAAQRIDILRDDVFDPDGYFDGTHLKPETIEAIMATFGYKSGSLTLEGVAFSLNVGGVANNFNITAGKLIHFAYDIAGGYEWQMGSMTSSFTDSAQGYYIYAKISKTALTGVWVVNNQKLQVDNETGYYTLLIGRVYPVVSGKREIDLLYGVTNIVGNRIQTGIIQDLTGTNFWNLETGAMKISGQVTIGSGSNVYTKTEVDGTLQNINNQLIGIENYSEINLLTGSKPGKRLEPSEAYVSNQFSVTAGKSYSVAVNTTVSGSTGSVMGWVHPNWAWNFNLPQNSTYGVATTRTVTFNAPATADNVIVQLQNNNAAGGVVVNWITVVEGGKPMLHWQPNIAETSVTLYNSTNLLKNSNFARGFDDWTLDGGGHTIDTDPEYGNVAKLAYGQAMYANLYPGDTSQEVTVSLYAKGSAGAVLMISSYPPLNIKYPGITANWERYYVTFKWNSGWELGMKPMAAGMTIWLANIQVEAGAAATAYKVADGDLLKISNEAKIAAENADEAADVLSEYVDGAFKDGVIEAAEAKAIEKYINVVNETYEQLTQQYSVVYADTLLTGTPKTNLATAKSNLDTAKGNLISSINTAIADGKTTGAEKNDVDSKYATFKTRIGEYTTAVENAYKSITDAINAAANGKVKLFTTNPPSGYNAGDLWIPQSDYSDTGTTFKKDNLYRATTTSASFSKTHWVIATNYTDDTVANSKTTTFTGATAPTPNKVGDLWFDTTNKKWKTWNGSTWDVREDKVVGYIKDALDESTEVVGGLTLGTVMAVKKSGVVKAYMSAVGDYAFAAGVTNFADVGETRAFAVKHNGDIEIKYGGSDRLKFVASTGVLTINGTVNSTSGSIGGFTIESNKIKSATPAYGTPAFVLNKTDNKFEYYSGSQTDDGTEYGNIIPDITIKTGYGFGNSNYSGILAGVSCLGVYEDSIRRAATIGGRGITSDCSLVSFMPNKGGLGVESNTSILGRIVFSADQPLDSPFTFYDRRISAAIAGVTDLVQGAHGSRTYGGYFNSLFSGTLHTGVKVLENDSTHYFAGEFITTIYCTVSGGWLMFPEINHEEGRIIIIRNSSGGTVNLGRSSSENLSLGDNSSVTSTSIANKETQVWQRLNNRWRQILKQTF